MKPPPENRTGARAQDPALRGRTWLSIAGALTLLLLVTLAVLMVVGLRGFDSFPDNSGVLRSIAISQPFSWLSIAAHALRVYALCGGSVTWKGAFEAVCVMQVTQQILPGRLSEGAKPVYLRLRYGLPLAQGISISVVERFLDIVCMGFLLVSLSVWAASEVFPALHQAAPVFLALACVGVVGILVLLKGSRLAVRLARFIPIPSVRHFTVGVIRSLRRNVRPRQLAAATVISIAAWLSSILLFAVYFGAAGTQPLSLSQISVVFAASTLGIAVALAPGGLGTFEAATIAALHSFGYGLDEALVMAISFRLANNVIPVVVTLWLVGTGQLRMKALLDLMRGLFSRR